MKELLFFNTMFTAKIITFIYWILLLISLVSGLSTMFGSSYYYGGATSFFMGLGIIIGGALGSRIWCELLIVIFKIHDNLKKVAEK